MPARHRHTCAAQQTESSFREALAAICRGNFLVVTCINLLLMTAQCVALIVIIPMTEQALKATFDDEGVRKQQP